MQSLRKRPTYNEVIDYLEMTNLKLNIQTEEQPF